MEKEGVCFQVPAAPHPPIFRGPFLFLKRPQLGILLPPLSATWAPSLGRSPPPPPLGWAPGVLASVSLSGGGGRADSLGAGAQLARARPPGVWRSGSSGSGSRSRCESVTLGPAGSGSCPLLSGEAPPARRSPREGRPAQQAARPPPQLGTLGPEALERGRVRQPGASQPLTSAPPCPSGLGGGSPGVASFPPHPHRGPRYPGRRGKPSGPTRRGLSPRDSGVPPNMPSLGGSGTAGVRGSQAQSLASQGLKSRSVSWRFPPHTYWGALGRQWRVLQDPPA